MAQFKPPSTQAELLPHCRQLSQKCHKAHHDKPTSWKAETFLLTLAEAGGSDGDWGWAHWAWEEAVLVACLHPTPTFQAWSVNMNQLRLAPVITLVWVQRRIMATAAFPRARGQMSTSLEEIFCLLNSLVGCRTYYAGVTASAQGQRGDSGRIWLLVTTCIWFCGLF